MRPVVAACDRMVPGLRCGIVRFAGIRIDNEGLLALRGEARESRFGKLALDAVEAERFHMRIRIKAPSGFFERGAVGQMPFVSKRHRDPADNIAAFEHRKERFDFIHSRLRLDGKQVGARLDEGFEAELVEGDEFVLRELIAARIFAAVGEIGAVRADRARDQKIVLQ